MENSIEWTFVTRNDSEQRFCMNQFMCRCVKSPCVIHKIQADVFNIVING